MPVGSFIFALWKLVPCECRDCSDPWHRFTHRYFQNRRLTRLNACLSTPPQLGCSQHGPRSKAHELLAIVTSWVDGPGEAGFRKKGRTDVYHPGSIGEIRTSCVFGVRSVSGGARAKAEVWLGFSGQLAARKTALPLGAAEVDFDLSPMPPSSSPTFRQSDIPPGYIFFQYDGVFEALNQDKTSNNDSDKLRAQGTVRPIGPLGSGGRRGAFRKRMSPSSSPSHSPRPQFLNWHPGHGLPLGNFLLISWPPLPALLRDLLSRARRSLVASALRHRTT
ncbi:hypothetical protein B0H17DRAFT_1143301 [Mycena rosella]|uniref:Uncharacterized protein n=1 Tax=Mycena rosella TaxID=1033263 RepID=A0AAD7G4N8_MYCRO|nr:hypothetical protein B0H17DRAFT_1143301 [Mycena rosella]